MLPKVARAKIPADFRPISSLRLLCKTFSYVLLSRIEATLDAHQPEEQHGFRKGLLTANLIIDKSFACNLPIAWICPKLLTEWIGTLFGTLCATMVYFASNVQ